MAAANPTLGWESKDKIRDVLASVLKKAARKYGLLEGNPMEMIQLPSDTTGKRRKMPYLCASSLFKTHRKRCAIKGGHRSKWWLVAPRHASRLCLHFEC
jgi:hypothetical protein